MPRRIFIDLTNLITYAAHFDRISGVQRVEIELIKGVTGKETPIRMMNMFDGDAARLIKRMKSLLPNEEAVLPFLKKEFSYCRLTPNDQPPERLGFFESIFKAIAASFRTKALKLGPGDIVFVPGGFGFAQPILKYYRRLAARGVKLVFLIHDVFPITEPDLTAPGSADYFRPAFELPSEIVTTAHFNAADFKRAYETVTKKKCEILSHVIPLAHEFPGVPRNAEARVPSKRLVDLLRGQPFVLSVGTVEIRKNHITLLRIWAHLKDVYGAPMLVIAGRRGWHAEVTLEVLDNVRQDQPPYVFIEGPTDEELKWLYASCEFSILPSLFEGWGLPVGESLWFGKACAASNTASIPEVGGDLCAYFDPNNKEQIKAAVRQLMDPSARKTFEDKIKAASLRTWADVAQDLIALLLRMAEEPEAVQ